MSPSAALEELLRAYRQARARGEPVEPEHLCRDCPELLPALRQLIATADPAEVAGTGPERAEAAAATRPDTTPTASELRAEAEPLPGYRLVRLLGRGGFGEVWEALAPGGFRVAFKFVALQGLAGELELQALEIIRNLRHPNLLTVFGTWRDGGRLIIGMELADATLLDHLQQLTARGVGGLSPRLLVRWCHDVARVIDYLNKPRHFLGGTKPVGIQHGDIKPQNILLIGQGVKVGDFGLVRLLRSAIERHTGGMTLLYAAPEVLDGQVSRWSDQYSLAVTWCQLRGGRLPVTGTTLAEVRTKLTRGPDLSMLPAEERPAVARALAVEPRNRWPDCRSFIKALAESQSKPSTVNKPATRLRTAIASPTTLPFPEPSPAPAAPRRPARPRSWSRALVLAAAFLWCASLTGVVLLYLLQPSGSRPRTRVKVEETAEIQGKAESRPLAEKARVPPPDRAVARADADTEKSPPLKKAVARADEARPNDVSIPADTKPRPRGFSDDVPPRSAVAKAGKVAKHSAPPKSGSPPKSEGPVPAAAVGATPSPREPTATVAAAPAPPVPTAAPGAAPAPPVPTAHKSEKSDHAAPMPVATVTPAPVPQSAPEPTPAPVPRDYTAPTVLAVAAGVLAVGLTVLLLRRPTAPRRRSSDTRMPGPTTRPSESPAPVSDVVASAAESPFESTAPPSSVAVEHRAYRGHKDAVWALALSPLRPLAVSGGMDQTVQVWNYETLAEAHRVTDYADGVTAVGFTPDGHRLFSGSLDGAIRLWFAGDSTARRQFVGHAGRVLSVACSGDGTTLASCGEDAVVRLWDAASGEQRRQLSGHDGWVHAVSFAGSGVLSGGADATLRLWDARTGAELQQLIGHGGAVRCLAISPDSQRAVSGGGDPAVFLWDLSVGRELLRFDGHRDWVRAVAWTPDGRRVVSGGDDETLCVWDAAGGQLLRRFEDLGASVLCLAVTPDNRRVFVGCDDGSVREIELPT